MSSSCIASIYAEYKWRTIRPQSPRVLKVLHDVRAYRRCRHALAARAIQPVTSIWQWSDSANAVQANAPVLPDLIDIDFLKTVCWMRQIFSPSELAKWNRQIQCHSSTRLQVCCALRDARPASVSCLAQLFTKSICCFRISTALAGEGSLSGVGIIGVPRRRFLVFILALARLRIVAIVACLSFGLALLLI